MWRRLYSAYTKVFPFIKGLRGATRAKLYLKKRAAGELVEPTEDGNGYTYHTGGVSLQMIALEDFAEFVEADIIAGYTQKRDLQQGDIVIDAGAFPGEFTIYAAKKVGETGRVLAVEPDSTNAQHLRQNLAQNDIQNVEIIECGLWAENGVISFTETGGLISGFVGGDKASQSEVKTLDTIAESRSLDKIDFVKMDIEGAEMEALKGAEEVLNVYRPHFAVASYHVVDGERTAPRVEQLLADHGYSVETTFPAHLTTFGWLEQPHSKEESV